MDAMLKLDAIIEQLKVEIGKIQADRYAAIKEISKWSIKADKLQAENKELKEKTHYYMLQIRNISTPCKRCSGWGVKSYGNTSTWHHGIGGQMITSGVCDWCWGSGDENNKWTEQAPEGGK